MSQCSERYARLRGGEEHVFDPRHPTKPPQGRGKNVVEGSEQEGERGCRDGGRTWGSRMG